MVWVVARAGDPHRHRSCACSRQAASSMPSATTRGRLSARHHVKATVFAAYCLAGLFAGAASIVFVGQIGFVPMQTGNGQELKAIAALVLGGVSLTGGVGTICSAVIGALFLTAVDSMMIFLKVPGFWNNAVAGAILLAVVLFDYRIRRTVEEQRRRARASEMKRTGSTRTAPKTKTPPVATMEKADDLAQVAQAVGVRAGRRAGCRDPRSRRDQSGLPQPRRTCCSRPATSSTSSLPRSV